MNVVEIAQRIATEAHADQKDKTGHPYIGHPTRVAERTRTPGGADDAVATAWLHDVIEDTDITGDDLIAQGIPAHVVAAVEALSKRSGEAPEDYFSRVNAEPLAIRVKHADLDDNTDPERVARLDDALRERLAAKYLRARQLLSPIQD